MAAFSGPEIPNGGLVFDYDMSNTKKSWNGAPTTNMVYAVDNYLATPYIWVNSGAVTSNLDENDVLPPITSLPSNLKIISGICTTTGSIHYGCAFVNCSPSVTYTISVWFRQNRAGVTAPYMRTSTTNIQIGTFYYNGVAGAANWPVNEWIRITATGTTPLTETAIFLSNYLSNVGDKVWYYGSQVEQQSFMTPAVAGARSTTQTILDLTNNNTITASSLTYAANNTFSFNGTSNYIDCGVNTSLDLGTGSASVAVWFKTSAVYGCLASKRVSSGFQFYVIAGKLYADGAGTAGISSTTVVNDNIVKYGVCVYDRVGNLLRLYVNGVADNTVALGATTLTDTANCNIGRKLLGGVGDYFNGAIYSSQIYNRALTATEVSLNFEAMRDRYGI